MKRRYLAALAGVVSGLPPLACSSGTDDIVMGSDGGSSSAGSHAAGSGTAGDRPSGGTSSSGGSTSSGGTHASGGEMPTGGTSSGGDSPLGGTASDGGTSSGGGGAPSGACQQSSDCTQCDYPKSPATAQDCYCVTCPGAVEKDQCSANKAQYEKVCAAVPMVCPAVRCATPADPICQNKQCVTPDIL